MNPSSSSIPSKDPTPTVGPVVGPVHGASTGRSEANTSQDRVQRQADEIVELKEKNEALADAVVNSAEIIEELDRTRNKLAEAQNAAEQAHQNTQMLARTIFEGTHDAMVVLDKNYALVSANRNARSMFGIEKNSSGSAVMQQLTLQYRSVDHLDWLSVLLAEPHQARIELYKLVRIIVESPSGEEPPEFIHKKHWVEVSISTLNNDQATAEYLLTAHDITKRKLVEDQVQHQALHDNVTRLPNRRFFVKKVEELIGDSNTAQPFSICFLDLDNFKTVNDSLGHDTGDQLLVKVARRITQTMRNDCFLARFGGDEFALLMPNLSAEEVTAIGNRIVAELNNPFVIDGNQVYVGVSIGMTRFPDDALDVNSLMQNADVAMYAAKDNGRNCFHPFTPKLAVRIQERQTMLEDLRKSLERRDIELEYQPKWCLRTNRISGCEALLRWKRNGEPVSAAHLVEVAECSGLILPLGDQIAEVAVNQMAEWQDAFLPGAKMAINLSPRQLVDRDFTYRFKRIIDRARVSADSIELEITETAMMENFEEAFQRIKELRSLGVTIAIDDFGTGYSSLSYLKSFPVSTIKIDRSFVSDLPDDSKAVAVAKAILALGQGLGLNVVAEGVETCQQNQFLVEAGCDQVQGYLYSPSMKPGEFAEWAWHSTDHRTRPGV